MQRSTPAIRSPRRHRRTVPTHIQADAASQFIELHSIPSSQGRFAGYRMVRDQSADIRTIAAISR
jgi:hypothetical protein